jgi:hypothetical protein
MSDFGYCWLIRGVRLGRVRAWLRQHKRPAFVGPASGGWTRVFPAMSGPFRSVGGATRPGVTESLFTKQHADGALIAIVGADVHVDTSVWRHGKELVTQRYPSVPTDLYRGLGVASSEVAELHYGMLLGDRLELEAEGRRVAGYASLFLIDADGREEPFYSAPAPEAKPPADPARLSPATVEKLAGTLERGPTSLARERAARQLARAATAPGAPAELQAELRARAAEAIRGPSARARGAWALLLHHLPRDSRSTAALGRALAAETDPEAARRLYEAFAGISHEPDDRALLAVTASDDPIARKGAYALLATSPLPAVHEALRARDEPDPSARALLERVLAEIAD